MVKRRYRFGKPALARFMQRNMLLVETNMGAFPVWKRNTGRKGTNMWAFAIPQPTPTPQPEPVEPLVEVEIRDVEAPEPRTPNEEEDSQASQQVDTGTGGGLEEAARTGDQE